MQSVIEEIVFVLTPFVVACFAMYLIGSFVSVSTNPADWTEFCRIVCAIWGITFGFALWLKLEMSR